ncbi:MAG: hypothetical protein AABY15_00245 [Nanoarchaeota archaeon]
MIGKEFEKQLLEEGINPGDVKKFTSKYNKKNGTIVTLITMEDDSKHTITNEVVWYAARKNKKW